MNILKRGEIILVDLGTNRGSEVNRIRPAVIIQNDIGNKFSPTTIIAPISNRNHRGKLLSTHVLLENHMFINGRYSIEGVVLLEQIRTIDKIRIMSTVLGKLNSNAMELIRTAALVSLAL